MTLSQRQLSKCLLFGALASALVVFMPWSALGSLFVSSGLLNVLKALISGFSAVIMGLISMSFQASLFVGLMLAFGSGCYYSKSQNQGKEDFIVGVFFIFCCFAGLLGYSHYTSLKERFAFTPQLSQALTTAPEGQIHMALIGEKMSYFKLQQTLRTSELYALRYSAYPNCRRLVSDYLATSPQFKSRFTLTVNGQPVNQNSQACQVLALNAHELSRVGAPTAEEMAAQLSENIQRVKGYLENSYTDLLEHTQARQAQSTVN